MSNSEHIEQTNLVQWLKINHLFYFSIPNGMFIGMNRIRAKGVMQKMYKEGLVSGASDIVVLLPNKILFIEMKKAPKILKNGKMSYSGTNVTDAQKDFIAKVNQYNYAVSKVCYGFIEAMEFIKSNME